MNTMTDEKKKRILKIRKRRILISWALIGVLFFLLGFLSCVITDHITKANMVSAEEGTNTSLETEAGEIKVFGSYDDRIFTQEISLDWGADEYDDFTPIDCTLDVDIQQFTWCLCKGYDLDFALVMAIMYQESSFQADVISATNDYGLMQINKSNHEWLTETLGVTDFLDPYQNIRSGCFILRKLFEKYQDTNMVLMAYNMGEDRASILWKNGVYGTSYSDKITLIQSEYYREMEGVELN